MLLSQMNSLSRLSRIINHSTRSFSKQRTSKMILNQSRHLSINSNIVRVLNNCRKCQQRRGIAEECLPRNEVLPHTPVMLDEVLRYMKTEDSALFLDATFGAGGHSRKLLESSKSSRLIALDRDPVGYSYAQQLSEMYPGRVSALHGKFSDLPRLLHANGIRTNSIDGILFDFGCSAMQFDNGERGFSLSKSGPLDMRMCQDPGLPTAADVLSTASEEDLYKIIKYYGEEKRARKIARTIVEARYMFKRLETTEELADLVQSAYESYEAKKDMLQRPAHVATKTFQALRIFVNNELNEINYGMIVAGRWLKIGGRLVTITFHSLEDTIVKRHLAGNLFANAPNTLPMKYRSCSLHMTDAVMQDAMDGAWRMLHKHVMVPRLEEVESNPRARSAKLRAAIRIR